MEGEADVGEQNSCTPFINHPSLVFLPPRKPFGTLTPTTGKAGAQTARAGRGRAGGRLVAVLVLMIMVGVVAMYWVKYRSKERRPAQHPRPPEPRRAPDLPPWGPQASGPPRAALVPGGTGGIRSPRRAPPTLSQGSQLFCPAPLIRPTATGLLLGGGGR
ncbi:transmembrane gamma-carboxyglutamic acid protein 2 isoform X1 [Chelonia mydas]|uniref:transmembrane gamma-carboxyglutamic acid protein 2 isoform X1 n=1 Tax=Chelonia mydas TaxID=8469 RepID=UPI001CA9F1DF|nr:transmembrane gamma-carboxyglutamic acid protein 2 isoform X1 [Chelonia mydas]